MTIFLCVFLIGLTTPALASSNLTVTIGPGTSQSSEVGAAQYRAGYNLRSTSYIYYERPSPLPPGEVSGLLECESVIDPNCEGPGSLYSRMTAPACDFNFASDCVAKLAIELNGNLKALKLYWNPESGRTKGSRSPYTPVGALPPLYELPTSLFGTGVLLAPLVQNTFSRVGGYFTNQGFSAAMALVRVIPGEFQPIEPDFSGPGWSFGRKSASKSDWQDCLWTIPNGCVVPAGELPQLRIQLGYRSGMPIGGWWHSRIDDPLLTTTVLPEGKTEIIVEGAPSLLQGLSRTTAVLNEEELTKLRSHPNFNETFGNPTESDLKNLDIGISGSLAQDWRTGRAFSISFAVIDAIKRTIEDQSKYEARDWSINTLFFDPRSNPCYKQDAFQGLIATNSMLYSAFPPIFNQGSLEYEVGGVHRMSNGEVFKGKYSLILSNDLAKCLYGITSIPPMATVQITSADGTNDISTIIVNSDSTWTTLRAADFTFSKKVIGFSLSEKMSSAQKPVVPAAGSKVKKSTKRSITCVKGEKRKVVVAVKPRCPKGYMRMT